MYHCKIFSPPVLFSDNEFIMASTNTPGFGLKAAIHKYNINTHKTKLFIPYSDTQLKHICKEPLPLCPTLGYDKIGKRIFIYTNWEGMVIIIYLNSQQLRNKIIDPECQALDAFCQALPGCYKHLLWNDKKNTVETI